MDILLRKGSVWRCVKSIYTGFGLKDGNSMDNFVMLGNIDKMFGMFLEDLITTNNRHFLIDAKIGQKSMSKDFLSNTDNNSEMRTCSITHTESDIVTPVERH